MKVGIISDIHDNIWNLEKALRALRGADVVLCCGDLCSPFIIDQLGKGFSGPIHIVFGNNDADRFRIAMLASNYPNIHLHGEFLEIELDGRLFAVNHFDNIGCGLAGSEKYDVVCFGHNHCCEIRNEGKTLVINPGEIFGGLSAEQAATFVVFDTATEEAKRYEV